jgi:hypothetical protein
VLNVSVTRKIIITAKCPMPQFIGKIIITAKCPMPQFIGKIIITAKCPIIRVFRSSVGIRRVMRAPLEWMPTTPYKLEMVQVCQQRRIGVHDTAVEANDTKLRLIET